jgi:hypothetical protein
VKCLSSHHLLPDGIGAAVLAPLENDDDHLEMSLFSLKALDLLFIRI